jgi:hypothetical protein
MSSRYGRSGSRDLHAEQRHGVEGHELEQTVEDAARIEVDLTRRQRHHHHAQGEE